MVNYLIEVPKEYQYLSNWSGFDSIMPPGHIIPSSTSQSAVAVVQITT